MNRRCCSMLVAVHVAIVGSGEFLVASGFGYVQTSTCTQLLSERRRNISHLSSAVYFPSCIRALSDDNEGDCDATSSNTVEQTQSLSPKSSSPWASAIWILRMNFGRSSASDEGIFPFSFNDDKSVFGASGSRLVITCPVLVTAEDVSEQDRNDAIVVRGASVIRPIYSFPDVENKKTDFSKHYSYVSLQGQQSVKLSPGGWVLEFPPSGVGTTSSNNRNKGLATKLRFWLDLDKDIERNDIKLPAGTRLYFAANCWREEDFDFGVAKLRPIQQEAEAAVRAIKERLSHESGDRRLDGVDAIETIQAYGDMAKLVLEKEQKMAKLQEAVRMYPSSDDDVEFLPDGPWPGSDEWLTLSDEKYNPIFILKDQGILRGQEYEMVGTWTGEALLEED
ncbi:hypothetical protein IV203_030254 [Nitzschia inconspicua]|uniref:Uncharacterized protein n=1 Tax=Nitzschia inconspicua TaxID=303405 RepID=A0A9K3LS72_9STRA|nr:hypothetical protein IV203_030254 [Nitzschia inconspicua]